MHFRESEYLMEMGALQATLKGTVTKTLRKKCENRVPKIGSFDTN